MNHQLGFHGNRRIDQHLQKTAMSSGLRIETEGHGRYRVEGAENIDGLCPSHINHKGSSFSLEHLKSFLEFMHQPLRSSMQRALPGKDKRAYAEDATEAMRLLLRRVTKGAFNGFPHHDVLGHHDNHDVVDHRIEERILRNTEREIGNDRDLKLAVPGTQIDPERGYAFSLHPNVNENDFPALQKFRTYLSRATNTPYDGAFPEKIYLKADELFRLCEAAAGDPEFIPCVHAGRREEEFQGRLGSIEQRSNALAHSPVFSQATINFEQRPAESLATRLRQATETAITPIVSSDVMRDVWALHHFSDRKNSPLQHITEECEDLGRILHHFQAQGTLSPMVLEAITHEFYSLIALSRDTAHMLNLKGATRAFEQASLGGAALSDQVMDPDHLEVLKAIRDVTGHGASPLAQMGQAGIKSTAAFINDIGSIWNQSNTNKIMFLAMAGGFYYFLGSDASEGDRLIHQSMMAPGEMSASADGFLNLTPSAEDQNTASMQAAAMTGEVSCHNQLNGVQMVRHCIYDSVVTNASTNIMLLAEGGMDQAVQAAGFEPNPDSVFTRVREATVKPLSDVLFKINLYLQNPVHAGLWLSLGLKGARHGPSGARELGGLFAPIVDATYRMQSERPLAIPAALGTGIGGYFAASHILPSLQNMMPDDPGYFSQRMSVAFMGLAAGAAAGYMAYRRNTKLSERLMGMARDIPMELDAYPEPMRMQLLTGWAKADSVRREIEGALPKEIRNADLRVGIGGLKRAFKISTDNYGPVLHALAQFDLLLDHVGKQIGVEHPWHHRFLKTKVENITQALKAYQVNGDLQAMQTAIDKNLEDVMGAQVRQTGYSPLYSILFDQASEHQKRQDLERLKRQGDMAFGQHKRADRILEHSIRTPEHLKTYKGAAIEALTVAWDDVVGTARWIQKKADIVPRNKWAAAGAGALTAAAVILDRTGQAQTVLGEHFSWASDFISGGAGVASTAGVTGSAFLNYNFWEDIVAYDVIGGGTAFAAGVACYYTYKNGVRPTAAMAIEYARR